MKPLAIILSVCGVASVVLAVLSPPGWEVLAGFAPLLAILFFAVAGSLLLAGVLCSKK